MCCCLIKSHTHTLEREQCDADMKIMQHAENRHRISSPCVSLAFILIKCSFYYRNNFFLRELKLYSWVELILGCKFTLFRPLPLLGIIEYFKIWLAQFYSNNAYHITCKLLAKCYNYRKLCMTIDVKFIELHFLGCIVIQDI